MKLHDMVVSVRDAISVRQVFGEPIEHGGTLLIPVASVTGGGGGGQGQDRHSKEAEGFGFGVGARPVGVFVVKDGDVRWVPSVDINRFVLAAATVAVTLTYLLTRGRARD